MLGCTSFIFVEGYLAAVITPVFDWSVVHALNKMLFRWDTGETLLLEAHEYLRRENYKDFSNAPEEFVVPVVSGRSDHSRNRTRRWHTTTIERYRNRLFCLGNLLLLCPRRSDWIMFTVKILMTTGKFMLTTVSPLRLVVKRKFGLSSTATVIYI